MRKPFFLDALDKRQEGLLFPSYFSSKVKLTLFKKINLIQEVPFPRSRTCLLKACEDGFILSPSCSTLLHYYKYDVKSKKYEAVSFVRMPDSRNEEISGLCIKCIDFQHHAFTATVSDKSLHFGDPETFQFIDRILHPSAIWSHRISQLCPFNVITGGCNGEVFISDFRTASVVMTCNKGRSLPFKSNQFTVSWSTYSDRLVCLLAGSDIFHTDVALSLFDLRKPQTVLGPKMNCTFNDSITSNVEPFVDFLESNRNLVLTIVNDSNVRIWDILSGELINTMSRDVGNASSDKPQPAIVPLESDYLIFVPDSSGINVYSTDRYLYSIDSRIVLNRLSFNKKLNHLIGLRGNKLQPCFIWECGK